MLLRCLLFWSLFLPLGGAASVDRLLRPPAGAVRRSVVSCGTAALVLQLCQMYWFSAALKDHPAWTTELSAVYYALSLDSFSTALGRWLLSFPRLLQGLTAAVFWLEILGPGLLLLPLRGSGLRMAVVLAFVALHVGLAVTLELELFPWTCIAAWSALLPGAFWDFLLRGPRARRAAEQLAAVCRRCVLWARPVLRRPEQPRLTSGWIPNLVAALLVVYVLLWNVREIDLDYFAPKILPRSLNFIGRTTGLDQRWDLFAPFPLQEDGWYVAQGVLHQGQVVNLWQPGEALPWDKPDPVGRLYSNRRWRKYLINLWNPKYADQRQPFASFLRWRWNEEHSGQDPVRRVKTVRLVYRLEKTPPPGQPLPEPVSVPLGQWTFD